ncbi:MAG TPA: flagellar FlbD family protein [Terriglobales bacterium]|nr:flagellar FlbD family protein [Terriglobales bacterium]
MIRLTRLNSQALIVNSDLVKFVEQAPDTLITLLNGEKFMVLESVDQVVERIIEFRRSVLRGIFPAWDQVASVTALTAVETKKANPGEE